MVEEGIIWHGMIMVWLVVRISRYCRLLLLYNDMIFT